MKVQYAGKYRGVVLEHRVDFTAGGLWQWVVSLEARSRWDGDKKESIPLDPAQTITAFIMLQKNGVKGPEPIPVQLKNIGGVTGWDGEDLAELHGMKLAGKEVNFTVEVNEYQGKKSLRVAWLNPIGGMYETPKDVVAAMGKGWASKAAPKAEKRKSKGKKEDVV